MPGFRACAFTTSRTRSICRSRASTGSHVPGRRSICIKEGSASSQPALQLLEREHNVGRLPGCFELLLRGRGFTRLVLSVEAPPQSEERTTVARVDLEILPENEFSGGRLIVQQKRSAE